MLAAFNMLASANEDKRFMQAFSAVDKWTAGYKNHKDAIKMILRGVEGRLQDSYALMDTWFTNNLLSAISPQKALT